MAIERISHSGLQAHARAAENVAHNISQIGVESPVLLRTRFRAEAPPAAGVRVETEVATPARATPTSPALSPEIQESFVRDGVNLAQELTDLLVARRGFQANLAAERASRAFVDAALNLSA